MNMKIKERISKKTMIFIALLGFVFLFFTILNASFATLSNFNNMLADMVIPAVFALGMGSVFAVGGFDLSLGHIASIAALITAAMMKSPYLLVPASAIAVGVIAACILGAISGLIVSRFGVSSFITTLGMQFFITGIRQLVTGGAAVYISLASFKALAGRTSGVSHLLISLVVIGVLCYLFMERTTIGRKMQFIGANLDGSEYKGIDVRNLTLLAFVLGAVLAACGGVLFAARAGSVQINSVDSYLLDAITIAVLSKVLFGGKYKTVGIIAVAFLISMISTGIIMIGISSEWVTFTKGFIILVSMLVSKVK